MGPTLLRGFNSSCRAITPALQTSKRFSSKPSLPSATNSPQADDRYRGMTLFEGRHDAPGRGHHPARELVGGSTSRPAVENLQNISAGADLARQVVDGDLA